MTFAPCTVKDCARKAYTKGMCQLHYQRVRRHGSPFGHSGKGFAPAERQAIFEQHYVGTSCVHGHGRTLENTYIFKNKSGPRGFEVQCRECTMISKWGEDWRDFAVERRDWYLQDVAS